MNEENLFINFKNGESTNQKITKITDVTNWLCHEMQHGRVNNNNISLKKDITNVSTPLSIAFVKMAEKGDIDEVTASEHMEMFLEWSENGEYKVGNLRTYATSIENEDGELIDEVNLYQCLQDHKGQADWTPDKVPALWKLIVVSQNGVPYWSQPISQQDSYMKDDEVVNPDDGFAWVSDLDYNVWKPGVYGWHLKK